MSLGEELRAADADIMAGIFDAVYNVEEVIDEDSTIEEAKESRSSFSRTEVERSRGVFPVLDMIETKFGDMMPVWAQGFPEDTVKGMLAGFYATRYLLYLYSQTEIPDTLPGDNGEPSLF
jgi:hypothetical protein